MRKAESSLANPGAFALSVVRACLIFFGTTAAAHALAAGTTEGRFRPLTQQDFTVQISGAGLPSYLSWLGLTTDQELLQALANTVWLALVAMLFAVAFGSLLSGLVRIRGLGRVVGGLHGPLLAATVPGVLLYPIYRWADTQQFLPDPPPSADQTASSSVWFLLFWGAFVGLAVALGLTGQLTNDQRYRSAGTEIAAFSSASLPVRLGARDLGVPTVVLLLGLASAELLSGHNGLFTYAANRLGDGDLAGVLDVVVVVALIGAVLTLAADVLGITGASRADAVHPDQPTRLSEATWPLLAALTVLAVVAIVGYARDPILAAGQDQSFRTPTFGGPWLGTDGAGVSFVERLVVALGPTMVAAIIPGVLAGVVGGAVHWVARRSPAALAHTVTAGVDLFWWPLPLVLPLAHLSAGNPERSEFDVTVTLVTVAALTPLAVRALRRSAERGQLGIRPMLSVAVFLIAIAGSARIFLGFLGVTNGPHGPANADLGALVASGITLADPGGIWSVTPPALAGVVLLSLFYWLAGAISTPVPHRELAPATVPSSTPTDLASTEPPHPDEPVVRVGPLGPEELRSVVRQQPQAPLLTSKDDITIGAAPDLEQTGGQGEDDLYGVNRLVEAEGPLVADGTGGEINLGVNEEDEIDLRAKPPMPSPVQRRPVVNLAERKAAQEPPPAEQNNDDATVAITPTAPAATSVTGDQPSTEDLLDEDIDEQTQAELDLLNTNSTDLAADASKTIELRPSTLRRAGIVAPGANPPPERASTRSILAEQSEDYNRETPADGSTAPLPTNPASTDADSTGATDLEHPQDNS